MPTFNVKKAVIIMGIIFLVVAVIIIIVKLVQKTDLKTTLPSGNDIQNNGSLPIAGVGGQNGTDITGDQRLETADGTPIDQQVTTEQATEENLNRDNKIQDLIEYTSANPTLAGDGNSVQYYDQADNKFYKINDNGEPVAMTQKEFFNVDNVVWSPDKNKAILEYPDQNKVIYDFSTDKQISLPKHWQDFQFSPGGQQIVFKSIGYDPSDSWLAVVSNDGTSAKIIEKIGTNADQVISSWSPNNQTIAMYAEGQGFDSKTVYFVGLNGENFKSMTVYGRGFQPVWSPAGSRLLYSVYSSQNNMKPSLWTAEAQGEAIGANLKPLNLETWAEKCVFASDSEAYCAVPQSLPDGAGLLPTGTKDNGDNLYLVNLSSGQTTIIDDSGLYNMTNLILTTDKQSLYFTDQKTNKLLKLNL